MKIKLFILIAIITIGASCKNDNSEKTKVLESKEKEVLPKVKVSSIEETQKSKNDTIKKSENETSELSNVENLIGNWFIPHSASINIKFSRDGKFVFNDFNIKTYKEEILTGEFKLENGVLSLLYDDRPKQKFKFSKGTNGDTNYYITKGSDYYFVKGESE